MWHDGRSAPRWAALAHRLRAWGGAPARTETLSPLPARPPPSWSWGPSFCTDPDASVHHVFASAEVAPSLQAGAGAAHAHAQAPAAAGAAAVRAHADAQNGGRGDEWQRAPSTSGRSSRFERSRAESDHVQSAIAERDRVLDAKLAHRSRAAPRGLTHLARKHARAGEAHVPRRGSCAGAGPWAAASRGVRAWAVLLGLLALWSTAEAPYRLAFGRLEGTQPPSRRLEAGALAVDIMFCADLVLHLAFFRPAQLPDASHAQLARAYATSARLPVDLLAALPLDFVAAAAGGGSRTQFSLGLLRLLRLRRVAAAFADAEADVSLPYLWVRSTKFLFLLLLQCHVFACIFYFVAVEESVAFEDTWFAVDAAAKPGGVPSPPLRRYLFSLYWAVTTLASVGYGDTAPLSDPEFLVAIVFMISNVGLFAYVVGNMTVLATAADESTHKFRRSFHDLEAYMKLNRLPEDVRASMRSYMLLRFNAEEEHREVLLAFPPVLRARVSRLLHLPVLSAAPMLAACGAGFVDALACHVSVELFMPGAVILSQFDASLELFFLASGTAEVLALEEADEPGADARSGGGAPGAEAEECVLLQTIGEGASFGEVPFLFHLPQPFTVRTLSLCRVLCLKREAWAAAEAAHPRDARIAARAVLDALSAAAAAAGGPLRRGILAPLADAVAGVMAARDAERVGELCLAAGRNDVLSLRRALAAGAAVNATDYDGRTALHVAAAKGSEAAVRYLIDHGASVNAVDSFGNTPLFEAVAGAHATAAAMLRATGASLGLRDAAAAAPPAEDDPIAMAAAASAPAAARRGRDAGTLMCAVAASGDVAFLSALLANGLPAGSADYDGRTGLHLAAALGRSQVLSLLLDGGADASARDNFGRTPLLEAVRAGHEACAALLRRRGGVLGLRASAGGAFAVGDLLAGPEMCQAAFSGDVDYLRRLLRAGAPPDASDYDARTAAHLACAEGLLPVALALHAGGADFGARDRWGRTPLDEADACGHAQLAHVLRTMPPPERPCAAGGERAPADVADAGDDARSLSAVDDDDGASLPGSAGALHAGLSHAWGPPAAGAARRRSSGVDAADCHVQGLAALAVARAASAAAGAEEADAGAAPPDVVGTWLAALTDVAPPPSPAAAPELPPTPLGEQE